MSNPLVGSTVLVQITVTDPSTGAPADATVELVVKAPDGSESTPTPDHPSTGVYSHYLDLSAEGWWTAIWTATVGELTTRQECAVCASPTVLTSP